MIDGDEFDLSMGTVSMLSLRPLSLAARSVADGSNSNDELPLLHRLVYMDVFYERHWLGNWLEQEIPPK